MESSWTSPIYITFKRAGGIWHCHFRQVTTARRFLMLLWAAHRCLVVTLNARLGFSKLLQKPDKSQEGMSSPQVFYNLLYYTTACRLEAWLAPSIRLLSWTFRSCVQHFLVQPWVKWSWLGSQTLRLKCFLAKIDRWGLIGCCAMLPLRLLK